MTNIALTSALSLQEELDASNERLRILLARCDRIRRENEEIHARNEAVERDNDQLRMRIATLSRPDDLRHD